MFAESPQLSGRPLVQHHPGRGHRGSCACSWSGISIVPHVSHMVVLHEGPAEERDEDHGQPRGHLGEGPCNVSVRNGEAVLLKGTVEGVEGTLVRCDLVNLVLQDKLLEGLGRGRGAVQGLVAVLGNRRRLVSQRLGNVELDQRRCADAPRVAEDVLLLAVDVAKLGRRGRRGNDSGRRLVSSACVAMALVTSTYVPRLLSRPAETVACAVAASDKD